MTEAQVATVMGGIGAEQFQMALGSTVQKSVQYLGPTVNYLSQGSISITFSNGRLIIEIGFIQCFRARCKAAFF